jgi:hypothetical protein
MFSVFAPWVPERKEEKRSREMAADRVLRKKFEFDVE